MKQTTPKNEEEEAEITETYKHSLLDTLRASYETNKEFRCTRVLYIGRMTSSKQKDIIETIHSNFIESQKSVQQITGSLLFINNNLFYHMIEVDSFECLESLFQQMIYNKTDDFFQIIDPSQSNKNKTDPELMNLTVKICCVSEEIIREFPIWSIRKVNLPGGDNNDGADKNKGNDKGTEDDDDEVSEDQEALQNVLFDTMKGMIEIGRQLCMKQDKDAAMKLFQSSQREIMNRFPTPDKIDFFMESKLLFDLKQFVDYFFTPINVKLESEYTWPIRPMITF